MSGTFRGTTSLSVPAQPEAIQLPPITDRLLNKMGLYTNIVLRAVETVYISLDIFFSSGTVIFFQTPIAMHSFLFLVVFISQNVAEIIPDIKLRDHQT